MMQSRTIIIIIYRISSYLGLILGNNTLYRHKEVVSKHPGSKRQIGFHFLAYLKRIVYFDYVAAIKNYHGFMCFLNKS